MVKKVNNKNRSDFMNWLIILIGKISYRILHLFGKGSTFPGDFALKVNKNIFKYFKMPKKVIFVTGTTGKTSVMGCLYEIYNHAGYRVASNIKGANLCGGVLTTIINSSKLSGKSKVDVLILEIDERYVKVISKYITPNYLVINNLSRDQLARNGHYELVFEDINKSIKKETTLLINADDPLVNMFTLDKENKVIYYGVKKNKYSTLKPQINTLDVCYCPKCHSKLKFKYFNYGNLGYYTCPNKDYNRPKCDFEADLKDGLKINGEIVKINDDALYNVYNTLVCYALTISDGVTKRHVIEAFNNLSMKVKRLNNFTYKDVEGTILLSKNETPISYNQSLNYISNQKGNKTVAIGFTRISGRYNLMDISWIYDINFELLNTKEIKKIILIGPYAYDLATRLELAGVDKKKFEFCTDIESSFDYTIDNTVKDTKLYFVVYFDLNYKYIDILKKRGVKL